MKTDQRRWSRAQPWEREGGEDTCGGQSRATRAAPERRRQSTPCVCTSPKQNLQNIPLSTFMLSNTQPTTDSGSTAQPRYSTAGRSQGSGQGRHGARTTL
jgi:hypothetical protein